MLQHFKLIDPNGRTSMGQTSPSLSAMHRHRRISWVITGLLTLISLSSREAVFGQVGQDQPSIPSVAADSVGSAISTEPKKDEDPGQETTEPTSPEGTPAAPGTPDATAGSELEGGLLGGLPPTDPELIKGFELFLEEGTVAQDSAAAKLARQIISRESQRRAAREEVRGIPFSLPGEAELDAKTQSILKTISDRAISLEEAVTMTLLHDPNIKLANEDELIAWAALQIAAGAFDVRLTAGASYGRTQEEVTRDLVREQEKNRDENHKTIREAAQEIRRREREIDDLRAGRPPSNMDIESQLNSEIRNAALDVIKRVSNPAEFFALASTESRINKAGIEIRKAIIRDKRKEIAIAERDLERFPINSVRRSDTVTYELGLLKKFRTGPELNPFLTFSGTEDNESRRRGIQRDSRTEFGIELMLPLARGRGLIAASGQEIAAGHDLEASRFSLQHTVAQRVLNTATAYWQLVAAQDRLQVLLESEIISAALVFVTEQMIAADAIPAIERSQIAARAASAQAARVRSEFALVQAQQNLAIAMGVEGDEILYAPLASDPLPALVNNSAIAATSPRQMVDWALQMRADRKAALRLEESGLVLTRQALTNLRPQFDFTSRTSYSGLDEGSHYESLYSPYLQGHAGPSYFLGLRFDYPFGNNFAKGALKESEARLRQAKLSTGIITRSILSNIVTARTSVQNSLRQISALESSRTALVASLNAEQERFKMGESTLLDTIQTEERLTGANSGIIEAKLQHAVGLAQLRFETGTIMGATSSSQASVDRRNLVTVPTFDGYAKNPPPDQAQSSPRIR